MTGAIPSTMSSKEQLKFRRAGGLDKKYNQELVAVLTDDLSTASNHLAVTAESISFTAGAAGTTGVVIVDKAPVYNADGGKIGHSGDTSFAWVTGTVLTAEVDYDSSLTDAAFLLTLANGGFAIDYLLGRIFYKKATTGTVDTCNYKTRQLNVEVTSSGVGNDVNLKQVAGTATVTGGVNGLLAVAGNTAHDAVDAGNPVKVGGKASTAKPAAVANADRVNAYFDEYGRLHTVDEGGSSVLPVTHRNPQDFTVAFTSNVTITVTGAPFTVADANCRIAYIYYRPTGGAWQSPLVNGVNGVSMTSAADVITVTGAGTPFVAADEYLVGIIYQDKAYTSATDSNRSEEISPLNQQVVEESLVDTTNVGAGPTYYPSSDGMQMLGYKNLSLTGKLIEGDAEDNTLTVEATNDEDATAASRDWLQIYGYDSVADANINSVGCNATTKTFAWDFDNLNYKYVRIKFVGGASATNTVICKARRNY